VRGEPIDTELSQLSCEHDEAENGKDVFMQQDDVVSVDDRSDPDLYVLSASLLRSELALICRLLFTARTRDIHDFVARDKHD
jgi:hypothetical protein